MRRLFCLSLAILLILLSCARTNTKENNQKIIAIDFPSYDAARAVLGSSDDLVLLLPPGTESHHYEPTPKDMIEISNASLVIYTGGESDSWVDKILDSLDKDVPTFKLVNQVELLDEEEKEGMSINKHESHDEDEEIDEHVWTSVINEIKIIEGLVDTLSSINNDSSELFKANGDKYTERLKELDSEIRDVIASSKHRTLVFASRFPFRYFTEEYGLDYYAAFPGCAEETEPSASTVAFLIKKLKQLKLGYVLDIEFGSPLIATVIASESGVEVRKINSMHNITMEQFTSGANYISIMEENINVLREVLN